MTRTTRRTVRKHPVVKQDVGTKTRPRRIFAASFLLAIVLGMSVFIMPATANAAFNFTIGDIPAAIRTAVTAIKEKIKDSLAVAGAVAVKSGIRIFYTQLAKTSFQFASNAGVGGAPLFPSDPNYWTDLVTGSEADFLDNLSIAYFGQVVARPGSDDQERMLDFLARGIILPPTACEKSCISQNEKMKAETIKEMQQDVNGVVNAEKAMSDPGTEVIPCPIACTGPPDTCLKALSSDTAVSTSTDQWTWDTENRQNNKVPASYCEYVLSSLLRKTQQSATATFKACMQNCSAHRAQAYNQNIQLEQLTGNQAVATGVQEMSDPTSSPLGQSLLIVNDARRTGDTTAAAEKAMQESRIGSVRTKSGQVKTPADVAQAAVINSAIEHATEDVKTITGKSVADIIATSVTNALIGRLFKAFQNVCFLNPKVCKGPTGGSPQSQALFGSSERAGAPIISATIGNAQFITGDPSRNAVSTLDALESKGMIDQRFRQAVEEQLTVGQALERGYLDSTRPFGFDANGNEPENGYTYRAMVYLRTARIVPVGWELAAQYNNGIGQRANIGLQELVDAYGICGQDSKHTATPDVKLCGTETSKSGQSCASNSDCNVQTANPLDTCNLAAKQCNAVATRSCTKDFDCQWNTGSCNVKLTASPFCGLVDPQWVLKAPLTYCRKQGAGEEILTKTFVCDQDTNNNGRVNCGSNTGSGGGDIGHYIIQRNSETCADEPSCIAENTDGTCRSYGYCFAERQSFRFNGTTCPLYYASCQGYSTPEGETVGFLTKTIDTNGCNADNAGCAQYCSDRNETTDTWMCTTNGLPAKCPTGQTCTCRLPGGEGCTVNPGATSCTVPSKRVCTLGSDSTYFDGDAQTCTSDAVGCHEYVDLASPSNLIANASFEQENGPVDSGTATVAGWGVIPLVTSDLNTDPGNRVAALIPAGGASLAFTNDRAPAGVDAGRPLSGLTFTLSYYAKASAASCTGTFGLHSADNAYNDLSGSADYTSAWSRFSNTFNVPMGAYSNDNTIGQHVIQPIINAAAGCDLTVDNVQLGESTSASSYAGYATLNGVYLNAKRRSCASVDVGCDSFTPKDGGPAITAVANWPDRCSADVVGCRAFREEPITHVPFRLAQDPVNLVASSGTICQASDVGCEEYTNLDVVAAGGEGREYYNHIQQCVKPASGSASQATYFTWIGDDRSGYQLKSYRLKVSNLNPLPGEQGAAPCTNIALGNSTSDDNPACEDSSVVGNPKYPAFCLPSDIGSNPDCTQFFDGSGHVFYRLRSRIIPADDNCKPYRNTIDGSGVVYLILASQSTACGSNAASCRAFTGSNGGNTSAIFSDNFEASSVVTNNWQGIAGGTVTATGESANAGGRSMDAAGSFGTQLNVLDGKLKKNGAYLLTFWAKPRTATMIQQAYFQIGTTQASFFQGGRTLALAQDWHQYTVGPVTVDFDPSTYTQQLALRAVDGSGAAAELYIDNVALNQITDRVYLIGGSYRTCADSDLGCAAYADRNGGPQYLKNFTRLCSADAVGCSALFDTQLTGNPFSSLPIRGVSIPADSTVNFIDEQQAHCQPADRGCSAFGKATARVDQSTPQFQTVYLKDQPDSYEKILCTSDEVSCSAFTPLEGSGSVAYFKDPGSHTCEYKRLAGDLSYHWYISGSGQRCPVVTPPADGIPTGRACVKSCSGGIRNGLACTIDTDCPTSVGHCVKLADGSKQCVGGASNGSSCTVDTPLECPPQTGSCIGDTRIVGRTCTATSECNPPLYDPGGICDLWTASCPQDQSGCNEYRDPSDPNPCRTNCPLDIGSTGKPTPLDENCDPTTCVSGARQGALCVSNDDCRGTCTGGSKDGAYCSSDATCVGGGTCTGAGVCSAEGIPGCRPYSYLRQSVEQNASECNGRVDPTQGCKSFNDTSNPTLNYRGS